MKDHGYWNATLIIKIKTFLVLNLHLDLGQFLLGRNMYHGPKTWPWWKLIVIRCYSAGVYKPSTGKRIWFYTRWGAFILDVVIDRRGIVHKRFQGWISSCRSREC